MASTPPLSVSQAALMSNIPKRTLQHAIAKGQLRAHKLPGVTGAFLISPVDFDRWLAGRDTKAAS
jgi:excisionase family DNA binding protein